MNKEIFEAECRRVWADAFVAMAAAGRNGRACIENAEACEKHYRRRYESAVPTDTVPCVQDQEDGPPLWAAAMRYECCMAQNSNGDVWECKHKTSLQFDNGKWSIEGGRLIGRLPLRADHATTYWAKTLEEKIFKITIYE